MKREAEQEMDDLCDKPNNIFKLVKFLKKEGQDILVYGKQYLRGINGRFVFIGKDQKRVWKEHMEKTINKENAWDQKTDFGVVKGPVEEVFLDEITIAIKKMKLGKAFGLLKVSIKMINTSGKVGINVMMKFVQE